MTLSATQLVHISRSVISAPNFQGVRGLICTSNISTQQALKTIPLVLQSIVILILTSLSSLLFAATPLEEEIKALSAEHQQLQEEVINKGGRLKEINQELEHAYKVEQQINSRIHPLELDMRKLDLEAKKISVKRSENRSREEITRLSKIKYQKHILNLKIKVEQEARLEHRKTITTLLDRQKRLQQVMKKLNRQERGAANALAELKGSTEIQEPPYQQAISKVTNKPNKPKITEKDLTKTNTQKTANVVTQDKQAPKTKAYTAKPAVTNAVKPGKKPLKSTAKVSKTAKKAPIKPVAKAKNSKKLSDEKSLKKATHKALEQRLTGNKASPKKVSANKEVKPAQIPNPLPAHEIERQKKHLDLLAGMQNIPVSTKALIRAKQRALKPMQSPPHLGLKPDITLVQSENPEFDEKPPITTTLKHLGNHQYIKTITIESGYQHFHIGSLKFTKRIDAIFNNKKAVIIIDARDIEKPKFEIHPVALEQPSYFTY